MRSKGEALGWEAPLLVSALPKKAQHPALVSDLKRVPKNSTPAWARWKQMFLKKAQVQ